jgi:hypothetical protein
MMRFKGRLYGHEPESLHFQKLIIKFSYCFVNY